MDIKAIIAAACRNLNTVIITSLEEDGSMKTRETEPYGYRINGDHELYFCYDLASQNIRSFVVSRIISLQETRNSFTPRRPVEV